MKKSIILAAALAAPVFAGDPAPVTVVAPTPPPPACCPLSIEVAAVYGFANHDIYGHAYGSEKEIDVYGGDITAIYTINENHSVNLRLGYTFGDECLQEAWQWESGFGGFDRHEVDIHTFTIMPGYRYTHALTDKLSVYLGANIGLANLSVKDTWSYSWYEPDGGEQGRQKMSQHDSDWGLAYSIEAGVSYKMSESWYVFATYGFYGSTAEPKLPDPEMGRCVNKQTNHGLRAGVGFSF